jgi:hypothetical protein
VHSVMQRPGVILLKLLNNKKPIIEKCILHTSTRLSGSTSTCVFSLTKTKFAFDLSIDSNTTWQKVIS